MRQGFRVTRYMSYRMMMTMMMVLLWYQIVLKKVPEKLLMESYVNHDDNQKQIKKSWITPFPFDIFTVISKL